MNRKFLSAFAFLFSLFLLFPSCKKKTEEVTESPQEESQVLQKALEAKKTGLTLGFVPGPSSLPFVYFLEDDTPSNNFSVKTVFLGGYENLLSSFLKNQVNAAVFSLPDAHKILSSLPDCAFIAGALGRTRVFLVTSDLDFSTVSSLKNKTVLSGIENSFEALLFSAVLKKNNVVLGEGEGQVHPDYSVPLSLSAGKLCDGFYSYGVLSEPFCQTALSKNSSLAKVLDLTLLYDSLSGGESCPEFILLVNSDYAKKNPSALSFLSTKFTSAVSFINEKPHKCAELSVKNHLFVTRKTVLDVIENSDFYWKNSSAVRSEIERFFENTGFEKLPDSVYFSF